MGQKITCVAIDDEPLALDVISKFCQRIGDIELHTFSNPAEGLAYILTYKPAIAFLDIEMENITGLNIASQLPPETCFIFTTAYLDYAMDGFELDAVDYLHKPFSFSRFQTAFNKALRRIQPQQIKPADDDRCLVVKTVYSNVSIPLKNIRYIEAMEGYVKIFREDDTCTMTRIILKNIGAQLPADEFIRIHRSYIVAKTKIKSYTKQAVSLASGTTLPVGRLYVRALFDAMAGKQDR